MLERICIGVDGSDCARRATAVGVAIAEAADAHVDLVYVRKETDETAEQDANAVLEDALESCEDASVQVDGHSLTGKPATRLVSFADEHDADLLVLGRIGRTGLGKRLLGSVVHSAFRQSDRPILTVPEGDGQVEISDLLVPTDGSEAAERAAPMAGTIATDHDATVHALYALDLATAVGPFSAGGLTGPEIERLEADRKAHVDRLADRLRSDDAERSIQTVVVRNSPHRAIRDYVDEAGVDLVVMSSRGQTSALGQVLGSVTDRVLRTVDVPVLVVTDDR
ncbi:UspA domain-containing protein [Salinarchaeum sp. Harcht-Bsk1]|uniref:universal stress protein n=1 Tax=Salinarchaeum sp. Harcht-Bsk1 TaxID=1333523 RepID=UPI0003422835|nr:universal stress protein [Salinarchaeum sp. Harcht-Bsk1]AGN00544.1 UspA domain-containing protein [Salinarchaeum sp. Harcht-Bsk1]